MVESGCCRHVFLE